MYFIDVIVLLVVSLPSFLLLVAGVINLLWLILSCPFKCIKKCCCQRRLQDDSQDVEAEADNASQLRDLVKKFETSFVFKPQGECIICMEPYKDDDDVTPLPCHESHYFHT